MVRFAVRLAALLAFLAVSPRLFPIEAVGGLSAIDWLLVDTLIYYQPSARRYTIPRAALLIVRQCPRYDKEEQIMCSPSPFAPLKTGYFKSFFSIFMLHVRGNSETISKNDGTLNDAICFRQYSSTSSGVSFAPFTGRTNALSAMSRIGSSTPITAAYAHK